MIFIAYISLLIAIAGALVYALASNAKAAELGRLAFACGLLATCFQLATKTLRLG